MRSLFGAPDFTPFVATVLEAPFEERTDGGHSLHCCFPSSSVAYSQATRNTPDGGISMPRLRVKIQLSNTTPKSSSAWLLFRMFFDNQAFPPQ